jgi:hypothetical protein
MLKRSLLSPFHYLFPDLISNITVKLFSKKLIREIQEITTDKFLELLLRAMDLSFCLSRNYRKNIKNFKGRYVFRTADNVVAAAITFANANMKVYDKEIDKWNVRITFKDAPALQAFLFSKNQDILDSILKNEVEVDGNLNYIHKFGFMARDLMRRFGVQ